MKSPATWRPHRFGNAPFSAIRCKSRAMREQVPVSWFQHGSQPWKHMCRVVCSESSLITQTQLVVTEITCHIICHSLVQPGTLFFVWFTWPSFVNNKYPVSNMNSKALSFMYDGVGLHYITFLWYQAHRLTEVWELSVRLLDPCHMYVIMYVYNIKNHVVIICK